MVNATTLARVKAHIGGLDTVDSDYDTLLTSLIGSVSKEIEGWIGYELEQTARVEYHDLRLHQQYVFLRVVPVVSVAEVKIVSHLWDFASVDALTADADYRLEEDGRLFLNVRTYPGSQRVKVTYTAGLGATDAAVVTAAPDLALAADIQVQQEWERRGRYETLTVPGPKGSKTLAAPHRFLDRVFELLSPYRRVVMA